MSTVDAGNKQEQAATSSALLRRLRGRLPAPELAALEQLVDHAAALDRNDPGHQTGAKDDRSFSRALVAFAAQLAPEQRRAFGAVLTKGVLSALGEPPPPPPTDGEAAMSPMLEAWAHLAKIAATLVTALVVLVEEIVEDDPEIVVPDFDIPT